MKKQTLIRTCAGMGLIAGLFLGCQESTGQKSGDSASEGSASAALMKLSIKDSAACWDLKARCVAAHRMGKDSSELDTTLVHQCVIDTAAAHRIGRGGFHMIRRGDRDDDFDEPGMDSAAAKAICDTMTAMLGKVDTASPIYSWFKHETAEACRLPMPFGPRSDKDSAADAKEDSLAKARCDSLSKALSSADTASAGYKALKMRTHEACEDTLSRKRDDDDFAGREQRGKGFDWK